MTEHRMPSRRSHLPDLEPPEPERARQVEGAAVIAVVVCAFVALGIMIGATVNAWFTDANAELIETLERAK